MLDARTLTGLLTLLTGGVFRDTFQGSLVSWSAVKQKSIALSSKQLKQSIMLWPMRSKRLFGYELFLACCSFLSHVLSPFLPIIRLLVHFQLLRLFLLAQSILIFVTISFEITFKLALSLPLGYQQKICQLIFLPNLFHPPFLLNIVMFLDFLFHSHNSFYIILFIFHSSLMGVCWP